MKTCKKFLTLILVLTMALSFAVTAFAADGNVSYEGGAEAFVFTPGSEYSPTDLFLNFKGVMPGDELTQQIFVKNDLDEKIKVKIYMRSLGGFDGEESDIDFLKQMNLAVKEDGKKTIFDAASDQKAQLTDWICLGEFAFGDSVTLDVTLTVPLSMGNDFQEAIGYVDWQFKAEEYPVVPTGDDTPIAFYVILGGVSLIAIVLFVLYEKKRKVAR